MDSHERLEEYYIDELTRRYKGEVPLFVTADSVNSSFDGLDELRRSGRLPKRTKQEFVRNLEEEIQAKIEGLSEHVMASELTTLPDEPASMMAWDDEARYSARTGKILEFEPKYQKLHRLQEFFRSHAASIPGRKETGKKEKDYGWCAYCGRPFKSLEGTEVVKEGGKEYRIHKSEKQIWMERGELKYKDRQRMPEDSWIRRNWKTVTAGTIAALLFSGGAAVYLKQHPDALKNFLDMFKKERPDNVYMPGYNESVIERPENKTSFLSVDLNKSKKNDGVTWVHQIRPSPAIYGDRVVWQDETNGNPDIRMLDITTGKITRITDDPAHQTNPDIFEDLIVWQDNRTGNWDIFMKNLTENREVQITDTLFNEEHPSIYGSRIVWEGVGDIWMYDLSSKDTIKLTNTPEVESYPVIHKDRVAWLKRKTSTECDIIVKDLEGGNLTLIPNKKIIRPQVSLYGDKMVYVTNIKPPVGCEITLYDLPTGRERIISEGHLLTGFPHINHDKVVYSLLRPTESNIFLYDLSKGKEIQVTTDKKRQEYPFLFEDTIGWFTEIDNKWNLYISKLK